MDMAADSVHMRSITSLRLFSLYFFPCKSMIGSRTRSLMTSLSSRACSRNTHSDLLQLLHVPEGSTAPVTTTNSKSVVYSL